MFFTLATRFFTNLAFIYFITIDKAAKMISAACKEVVRFSVESIHPQSFYYYFFLLSSINFLSSACECLNNLMSKSDPDSMAKA